MRRGELDVGALLGWLGIENRLRGDERWACCPLHIDREPSFQIRDDGTERAGMWRCFGCGARGGAPRLVQELIGVSYDDALEMMQERGFFGELPQTPECLPIDVAMCRLFDGFRMPAGVITTDLEEWVTPARRYAEQRGITPVQVARWRIGYGTIGRLNGRIVIPVHDGAGILRGFTARTYCEEEPRYEEPSVADGYAPGHVWGELWWGHRRGTVIVCEGAFNGLAVERVLSLATGGELPAVAAVRGSQLHPGHVLRLGLFAHIVVASDPDAAGEKLWQAMRAAFGRWSYVSRVVLEGGDANDIERDDPRRLAGMIAQALDHGRSISHDEKATQWKEESGGWASEHDWDHDGA